MGEPNTAGLVLDRLRRHIANKGDRRIPKQASLPASSWETPSRTMRVSVGSLPDRTGTAVEFPTKSLFSSVRLSVGMFCTKKAAAESVRDGGIGGPVADVTQRPDIERQSIPSFHLTLWGFARRQ
jgi:hypothetical protein